MSRFEPTSESSNSQSGDSRGSRLSPAQLRDLPICGSPSVSSTPAHWSAPQPAHPGNESSPLIDRPNGLSERFDVLSEVPALRPVRSFVARDRSENVEVLIEVCPSEATTSSDFDRVNRQVRLVQAVAIPGAARVRNFQTSPHGMLLMVERPSGHTLREEIQKRAQRQQRFSAEEAKRIGRQLCEIVRELHRQTGHRAISPETVWYADDGSLQLAGWLASAVAISHEEVSLNVLRTKDQRAVAAILYELLTGIPALNPDRSPQEVRSNVPAKLSKSVMRALSADPARRFSNLAAFQRSLLTSNRQTQQRLELATMLCVALFLVGGLWWWMSNRPVDNPQDRVDFAQQIVLVEDAKKRAEQVEGGILSEAKRASDDVDKWQKELINARESSKPLQEEYAQQRLSQALPSHEIASQVAEAWKQHRQRLTWLNQANSQLAKAKALADNGNLSGALQALKQADAQFGFPVRWQENALAAFTLARSTWPELNSRIEKSANHPGTPFAFPKRLLKELTKQLGDDDGTVGLENVRQAERSLAEIDRLIELRGKVTLAAILSAEISQVEEARSEVAAVEKVVHQGDDELAVGQFAKAESAYQSAIQKFEALPVTAIQALLASAEAGTAADSRLRLIDAVFRIKVGSSNVRPLHSRAYRLRAESLLAQDKTDVALQACNLAIDQDQLQIANFLVRAAVEIQRGDFQRAVADCDTALQLDQNSVTGLIRRGIARFHMDQLEAAIRDLSDAVSRDPRSTEALTNRGRVFAAAGQKDRARDDFDESLKFNPNQPETLVARAEVWRAQGEFEQALKDCNDAIRLRPDNGPALVVRGNIRLTKGELEKAITDLNLAVTRLPKSADPLVARGRCWFLKKDYQRVIDDFSAAIRLDGRLVDLYRQRGMAWQAMGQFEKALGDYHEALFHNPRSVEAYLQRGSLWLSKKETDKALADFTQALQLEPMSLVALSSRATVWMAKGDATKAVEDCSAALKLDPRSLSVLRLRAAAHQLAKAYELALADWNAVLAIEPKSLDARLGRGKTWLEIGEHDKAIEDLTVVISQDTKSADAFEARAKAWFKKGDQEKANADYAAALRLTNEAPKSKPQ